MGAKTWMLVQSEHEDVAAILRRHPKLNRERSIARARELFPNEDLEPRADGSLAWTNPPDDEICIVCFEGGVTVIAAKEFGIDKPSRVAPRFMGSRFVYLHAMHSVVDWCAFAKWREGRLVRSLSVAPSHGVIENIGPKFPFEREYWDRGQHPLDLGEAALKQFFGYQLEGPLDRTLFDPETIPLLAFRRSTRPWWRLW